MPSWNHYCLLWLWAQFLKVHILSFIQVNCWAPYISFLFLICEQNLDPKEDLNETWWELSIALLHWVHDGLVFQVNCSMRNRKTVLLAAVIIIQCFLKLPHLLLLSKYPVKWKTTSSIKKQQQMWFYSPLLCTFGFVWHSYIKFYTVIMLYSLLMCLLYTILELASEEVPLNKKWQQTSRREDKTWYLLVHPKFGSW